MPIKLSFNQFYNLSTNMSSHLIPIEINNIPDVFKESDFYKVQITDDESMLPYDNCPVTKKFISTSFQKAIYIYVPVGFDNFDQVVNNFDDIKRLFNLYRFWMVSDIMFFDLVYDNQILIRKHIRHFSNLISTFEMFTSLIILIKPIEVIYNEIVLINDIRLLHYLCKKQLVNARINHYAVRNLTFVNILKNYYHIIPINDILNYGILSEDITYLEYVITNYKKYIDHNIEKIINICCKKKSNNWIKCLINKFNNIIDFDHLLNFAGKVQNVELVIMLINDNYVDNTTELQIVDLFCTNQNSNEILNWLIENKMELNHVFQDGELIIDMYDDECMWKSYNGIETDNFICTDLSNFTLSNFLQLVSVADSWYSSSGNLYLMKWLLNNNIQKSTCILNRAIRTWKTNDFIWLYNQGYQFDHYTIELAVKCCTIDILKFLISKGATLNVTYELCNEVYKTCIAGNCTGPKMLQFLTSSELNYNIDNRYIIRSVSDNKYKIFISLYENYPDIDNYVFTGDNSNVYNDRLNAFIVSSSENSHK